MKSTLTREYLENKYNVENLTQREIALELGVHEETVRRGLKRHNIKCIHNNYRNYFCNENFFEKWSPDMAYILAFVTCDGYIHDTVKNKKLLCIDLQLSDIEILNFIKNQIAPEHQIRTRDRFDTRTKKNYYSCNLKISSKKIVQDLYNLGVTTRKTGRETLPDIPNELIPDYIRGLIDGDGHINLSKQKRGTKSYNIPKFFICSGSKQFLEDLQSKYLFGLGKIRDKKCNCYVLEFERRKEIIKILSYVYNGNFCLQRKYKKFLEIVAYDEEMSKNPISVGTMKGLNNY